jgi:PAS domain S-box-containing protein
MKTEDWRWKQIGITQKFGLISAILLLLFLLIAVTTYVTFLKIRAAEDTIRESKYISQNVLEMDQGMERAYRLHGDFFLHYQLIGLQKAHELYAQPSVLEIARVIKLNNELKQHLFQSHEIQTSGIHATNINLYLASAKRFAATSIEAVELISRRAAPERGIEARLLDNCSSLTKTFTSYQPHSNLINTACSYFKDYLINRERFLIQSSINEMGILLNVIEQDTSLSSSRKEHLFDRLDEYYALTDELLSVDLAITSKLRDFYLQQQSIAPVSKSLIQLTRNIQDSAELRIEFAHTLAGTVIPLSTAIGVIILIYIFRLINNSVTKSVLRLTATATAFSKGNLNARAPAMNRDELGQLSYIFNSMAERIQDLIENLETKVQQRTEELALSEERFRQLVRELPNIAVQGYDTERNILYWNRTSELLFGYSREEATGRKIDELIFPPEMQQNFRRSVLNWYKKDIPIAASELILRHKDDSEVPVYSAHVMQVDSHGRKTMYCIDVDLAELKHAQAQEQLSEAFYRELFDHSSSGVIVYEPVAEGENFIIKDINRAAEQIDNIKRDDVTGHLITDIFPGIHDMGLLDVLRTVLKNGEPVCLSSSYYSDEHTQGWRDNRAYRLPSGEIVTVYDDVTARKQAEDEKEAMELRLQRAQKMEAIGMMAGGIAHDLNNTLSAIIGYPELLLMQLPEDSTMRKPIKTIKEAGERAAAVVADLLTVARGVASTQQTTDLNTLVQEYLNSPEHSETRTRHPAIQFRQYLAANLSQILCSPIHVKKCIINLTNNAIDAVQHSGTISFATRTDTPNQDMVTHFGLKPIPYSILRITDNGPGIPKSDLEHIFEPFYTKRAMGKTSGTGLGLSVVWNTMKEHNGAVKVKSSSDGTIFDLYFPIREETEKFFEKTVQTTELQGKGEKILVVDDEPHQRELAKKILEHYGYSVKCADSGENAVNYLQSHQADLILLDMIMAPGINGRQTYEQITRIYPSQKAIIASGFSESDDIKATLAMGAGLFIKKPYTMQELALSVKGQLSA